MSNPAREGKGRYGNRKAVDRVKPLSEAGWLAKRRAERNAARGAGDSIEWAGADSGKLLFLIDAVTARGAAVTFGLTRDGSALRFSLFDGKDRIDEYCRPTESLETFVDMLCDLYGAD